MLLEGPEQPDPKWEHFVQATYNESPDLQLDCDFSPYKKICCICSFLKQSFRQDITMSIYVTISNFIQKFTLVKIRIILEHLIISIASMPMWMGELENMNNTCKKLQTIKKKCKGKNDKLRKRDKEFKIKK